MNNFGRDVQAFGIGLLIARPLRSATNIGEWT